jgi:Holliday junction resolvasome RuvABC endonuclease subunit
VAILALDLGAKCGWALYDEGELYSGTWELTPKKSSADREKETHLWRRMQTIHEQHNVTAVAFERVDAHGRPGDEKKTECPRCKHKFAVAVTGQNTLAAQAWGGYRAIVRMWCDVYEARREDVAVGTLKKFATGNGRATKQDMIAWAELRWRGQNVRDDNQADALHILDWMLVEKLGRRKKQIIDVRQLAPVEF